jgi:dihydrofolate reductase
MRKLVVATYVTLDGVIQPIDWSYGFGNEERGRYARDLLFASDALLLGRETFEAFAPVWSARTAADDGPGEEGFTGRINRMPKFVASTTLQEPVGWNATVIKGDVADAVATLKQQPGQQLLMYGCGKLAHTLLEHGLIDEFQFWVHPVVAGSGTRLFGDGTARLRLVDTRVFSAGFVILTCQPTGGA